MMRWFLIGSVLLSCLYACDRTEDSYMPTFSNKAPLLVEELPFGIHPLHNPLRLFEIYEPLILHLNHVLQQDARFAHIHIKLEASTSYATYEKKLYAGYFAFTLPNSYQTLEALKKGYDIFGKMADDDKARGIILLRKDTPIEEISQLKGKSVSYPACTAFTSTLLPQYFLYQQGLDIHKDLVNFYTGSQESVMMNVFLKRTIAGTTSVLSWERFQEKRPDITQYLDIRWYTQALPNSSLMVRHDISEELRAAVTQFFLNLHTYPEGQFLLRRIPLSQFEHATSETYQPVAKFMQQFMETVGIDSHCDSAL
jgi:phosphonate transport system substrate-binding protein